MEIRAVAAVAALCAVGALASAPSALATGNIPITTSSEEARQLYLKGRDLSEKLRATDARKLFEQAVAKDPEFALAHLGLANTAGSAKEFFAALARAVPLAEKASAGEKLLVCAADAGAKGEPARQGDCLTRLVQAYPDDERAHNVMGAYHFGRQDYKAAVEEYQKATTINPAFSQPYNQLGYAYRFLGDHAAAEKAFQRYIALIPDDPNPYDSYAELLMKMGRFEDSIRNYEKALAVDPNFVASHIGIGNNRVFMGQPAKARESYAKMKAVARREGEKRQAHFWTAMSYVHEGATEKALAEVAAMAAIDEAAGDLVALSGAFNQMGNILLEAGRPDEALEKYRAQVDAMEKAEAPAQVKEATRRQAMFDRARVALAKNDLTKAKEKARAYAEAVAAHGIPAEVRNSHELAGRIALAEKDYAKAAAELQQANQQDPRVLYLLGTALQAKGEGDKAREVVIKAADFNGLSGTYGYVRGKAKALLTTTKK